MLTVCSRDAPRRPGMNEYRMGRRLDVGPAQRPGRGQGSTGQTRRVRNLGPDVPAAALADEAGEHHARGWGVAGCRQGL
jgi:hypothetical protein